MDMPTHLIHRAVCGDGQIVGVRRAVISQPDDSCWPADVTNVRVPYCTTCKCVVSLTECQDERIVAQGLA